MERGIKIKKNILYFLSRYRTLGHTASQSRISTFYLLLDLMQFFDLFHAGQFDTAFDVSVTKEHLEQFVVQEIVRREL